MIDERTMQARLFKSFQHYPDQVAIEYQGKTITYGLLDQYSQAVALFLLDMEIPKETFIALAVQDKITLITLIIGILKAGCVFVPLDLNYPEKRTEAMVLASQTPYIMTDENHLAFFLRVRRNMPHRVDIITLHETFYRSTGTLNLQHYADLYRLSAAEQTRYKRQILMDGWGMDGQEKLKSTTVFVAGAGGSGSPLIEQLALCGFGTIIICDYDTVELSNLNRQSLHDESRIGKNKALSAQETVARLNPHVRVLARTEKITADNVFDLVGDAQIIFDNVDSLETKCILSKCAVAKGIPHTISSMIHMGAYACVFHTPFTPCFFCLYDAQKIADIHHAQEIQGTYQVIPNSVASPALFLSTGFVVNEAIKIILKMGQPAYNKYLYFNQYGSEEVLQTKGYWQITYPFNQHFRELSRAQGFDWDKGWHGRFLEEINITPDPHCPLCAQHHTHTTTTTSKTNPPVMPLPEIPYLPQD